MHELRKKITGEITMRGSIHRSTQQLWEIYQELITKWKGYLITTARSRKIDPEDLFDAVLAYLIEYKEDNIRKVIRKKATELYWKREIPFSILESKEDEDTNIIERLEFKNQKEEIYEESPLDALPEELKEFLLSRIRIEKLLPIRERIEFRKRLEEAKKVIGGERW